MGKNYLRFVGAAQNVLQNVFLLQLLRLSQTLKKLINFFKIFSQKWLAKFTLIRMMSYKNQDLYKWNDVVNTNRIGTSKIFLK